jgi:hypothetical protein
MLPVNNAARHRGPHAGKGRNERGLSTCGRLPQGPARSLSVSVVTDPQAVGACSYRQRNPARKGEPGGAFLDPIILC